MANRRLQPVDYVPFKSEPVLADGLIDVGQRPGGELLEAVSSGLFRLAAEAGQYADRAAMFEGERAGRAAAEAGRITIDPGTAPSGDRGTAFAAEVNTAIEDAAKKHNVDPAILHRIAQLESGGNPRAKNKSGAAGLFQFMPGTAADYGLADPMDPIASADAGARLARDNQQYLRQRLGRDPTAGEIYLAHQQGASGALKLLRNPDARAVEVVGLERVRQNGGTPNMSAREFAQMWTNKAETGGTLPNAPDQIVTGSVAAYAPQAGHSGVDMTSMDAGMTDRLALAGQKFGKKLVINSAFRSQARQDQIRAQGDPNRKSVAKHSHHTEGDAVDIDTSGMNEADKARLVGSLVDAGFTGFGEYGGHLHADMRDTVPNSFRENYGGWTDLSPAVYGELKARGFVAGAAADTIQRNGGTVARAGRPVSVGGGTWRPTGSNTIYGRAYDEAGSRAYLRDLDTEMRSTAGQLFERYTDDPESLRSALGDLRGELRNDHVFDEISGEFDNEFTKVSEAYLAQARQNKLERDRDIARGQFIENTAELATNQQRLIAGMDPNDPNATATVTNGLASIEAQWDDAVSRKLVTAEQGAKAKLQAKRDFATAFYGRQAELLDAEGVEGMHKKLKADFAAGGVPGLDAEGFATLDQQLTALEAGKRQASKAKEAEHTKTGDSFVATVAAGFEPDPAAWSRYVLDAGDSPEGQRAIAATEKKMATARTMRGMSIEDGAAHVAELRKTATDTPSDENLGNLAVASEMQAEKVQTLADLQKAGDAFAARMSAGYEPDPVQYAAFVQKANQTPEGKQALAAAEKKMETARKVRDLPLPEGDKLVKQLQNDLGKAPSEEDVQNYVFAAKALQDKREAVATDPVSYGEQTGLIKETPLLTDGTEQGQWKDIMTARVSTADTAAAKIGTSPRYLKAGEAAALGKAILNQPELGAQIAAEIVAGAGDRALAVLSEFGADAPMISQAGKIILGHGDARAAEDVLIGYGKDSAGKALPGRKPAATADTNEKTIGAALTLAGGGDRRDIYDASEAIAKARYYREGRDPQEDGDARNETIAKQSLSEAAGAVYDRGVQYGGFTDYGGTAGYGVEQVLVPNEIRADQFETVIGAITDADLEKLPVKPLPTVAEGDQLYQSLGLAQTIQAATPVAIRLPDGRYGYAFAMGDDPAGDDPQWIQGDNGELYVLDILAMKPTLAPRTVGAWRY